ncbi:MAG: endolytic transglycosylase MltG [Paracoccaceae bacterium]
MDEAARPDVRLRDAGRGATSWQVVEALKRCRFPEQRGAGLPEGSLAPDGYEIARLERAQRFWPRCSAVRLYAGRSLGRPRRRLPYRTPEEALVMASIVEKETGVPEERRQVASVFVNRPEQGMKLQTDPTVIYGVTGGRAFWGAGCASQAAARNAHNTYVIDGLPPTPIANPGRASIRGRAEPRQHELSVLRGRQVRRACVRRNAGRA